ncbi:MAG: small basic protein [Planctomycetota bacterium]
MSIHNSLVSKAKLQRSRNVWTRIERIAALKKVGKYTDQQSVFGLSKVRTSFKAKKIK